MFWIICIFLIFVVVFEAIVLISHVSTVMKELRETANNNSAWSLRKALMIIKLLAGAKAKNNFIGCLLTVSTLIWWLNYQY